MRFCLISGESGMDREPNFVEEAEKIFDEVVSAPLNDIQIFCSEGKISVMYQGRDLTEFDAIYVRVFEDDFLFAEIILDILEKKNIYLPAKLKAYQITNHKFYSVQYASRVGLDCPDSALMVTPEQAMRINNSFGFPIILKLLRGFGGKGVMKISSEDELKPVLDTLHIFDDFLSSQKFVPNSGEDLRALVIGDNVIGIKRKGAENEWRANVSQGGSAKIVEPSKKIKELSLKVAKKMGMEICAIDFIETSNGEPVFIEANFTPGTMNHIFGNKLNKEMLLLLKRNAENKK